MVLVVVLLGALLDRGFALGPPPCGTHEIELFPAKCGKTEHGKPIGKATGSYCATRCNATELCPKVNGTNATCSMSPPDLPFLNFGSFWKKTKRYFNVFGRFFKLIALSVSAVVCAWFFSSKAVRRGQNWCAKKVWKNRSF